MGLMHYRDRCYAPALGRFIQADTVVPEPGNPQDLNRYAYVRNNPLKYTDSTGYFSEEEIMAAFDVETWGEVIAFFEEGGDLEGRWGWLEVLRRARFGDIVEVLRGAGGNRERFFAGVFDDLGSDTGQIFIRGTYAGDDQLYWLAHITVGEVGDEFVLYPDNRLTFRTDAVRPPYNRLRFNRNRVDWVGAGLDAGGILLDAVSLGTAGKAPDVAKLARRAGMVDDLGAFARSWASASVAAMKGDLSGYEVIFGPEAVDLYVDAADLVSPVPFMFDGVGLYLNFSRAVYRSP